MVEAKLKDLNLNLKVIDNQIEYFAGNKNQLKKLLLLKADFLSEVSELCRQKAEMIEA